jgi:hypothetical protein
MPAAPSKSRSDVTRNGFFALSQRSTGGGEAQACLANAHANHAF